MFSLAGDGTARTSLDGDVGMMFTGEGVVYQ